MCPISLLPGASGAFAFACRSHARALHPTDQDLSNSMAQAPLHDPLADPHAQAAHETRNTTCYMCACRCGIRVHLRDGKLRYNDGNPDHPLN